MASPESQDLLGEDSDSVWSPDIEQAFDEALQIYPPCGRRKIILTEEGKTYGRNELIARYIKMKTGKTRTRKQVSSHLQVLARKKQRELHNRLRENPEAAHHLKQTLSGLSSAEIVSSSIQPAHHRHMTFSGTPSKEKQEMWHQQHYTGSPSHPQQHQQHHPVLFPDAYVGGPGGQAAAAAAAPTNTYNGIARLRLALDHFSAFFEYPMQQGIHHFVNLNGSYHFADPGMEIIDIVQIHDKFPGLAEMYRAGPQEAFFLVKFWVNMAYDTAALPGHAQEQPAGAIPDTHMPFFGLSTRFESLESMPVECSTAAISLGKQVMEKVQTVVPQMDAGRYVYALDREPLCQYVINFIQRLRQLDNIEYMNRVLDNFFMTQTIRARDTGEVLFSIACSFDVAQPGEPSAHHVYKLMHPSEESLYRRYTA